MSEYSKPLGDIIRRARKEMDLTQNEVADLIDVDVRTIINIENYKGNPKMEILYPLVKALKIDARELFYPEMQRNSPSLRQLRLLVEDCSEGKAAAMIPVLQSVVAVLRNKTQQLLNKKRACSLSNSRVAGSALLRRAHLLVTIFSFTTSMRISFLHLGQKSGKFTKTVSSYTLVLVLPPQIGQRIHKESSLSSFIATPLMTVWPCV